MGQDWKTLAIVVVGAALAGWLMVRALSGGRRVEAPAPPVAMASVPAPAQTAALAADAAPAAPRSPARAAALPPSVADVPADGDESAAIERDLGALAGLLVRDQRIEDRVMPRINDVVEVPGVTSYRRAPDFWEPALGGQGMAR